MLEGYEYLFRIITVGQELRNVDWLAVINKRR